jgi:hypothetical protein
MNHSCQTAASHLLCAMSVENVANNDLSSIIIILMESREIEK